VEKQEEKKKPEAAQPAPEEPQGSENQEQARALSRASRWTRG
jgi:hypothetical protein